MICQRCRTGLLSRLQQQTHTAAWSTTARQSPLQRFQLRAYSDGKPTVSATPPPPTPRRDGPSDVSIPSAVSSAAPGVSQPLSTPGTVHIDPDQKPSKPAKRTPSSCVAGSKMNGLNYFKNKPDVIALEDHEYPEWLWGLLDETKPGKDKKGGVDPSTLNKKQRKRYEKKMAARAATLPPQIPVHHHATDITPNSLNNEGAAAEELLTQAAESLEKRTDITKSARFARRKAIREDNFLRGL